MTLTEEEAKTKRCQESFGDNNVSQYGHMFAGGGAMGGAFGVYTSPSFCIASACMAWRWRQDDISGERPSTTHGYCGKAGNP